MSKPKFDVESFRKHATARSEPRNVAAATRASYSVDIFDVWLSAERATLLLRERGKLRGVDVFLELNRSALMILLDGLSDVLLASIKEQEGRAEAAERKANILETALSNLAYQALELRERTDLPEDQLPKLLVGQTWGWELAEHARASAEEEHDGEAD